MREDTASGREDAASPEVGRGGPQRPQDVLPRPGPIGRLFVGDIARDFPAAAIIAVANLVVAQHRQFVGVDKSGFSRRRHHAHMGRRLLRQHAHQVHAEPVDNGGVGLRRGAHLDAGLGRYFPGN